MTTLRATPPLLAAALLLAGCPGDAGDGDGGPGEVDAGPGEVCVIGDETAAAEIELVWRTLEGEIAPLVDGQEVPLILPIQGGKVSFLGIRARNISCDVQLNGGFFDDCQDPPRIFGRDARPVRLVEDDEGFGVPQNSPDDIVVSHMVNVPVCPGFVSLRDGDNNPTRFELRVTEVRRPGEEASRSHVLTGTVVPVCAQPEFFDECSCECDADFSLDLPQDEQCPTIHDNDLLPGACPGP